MANSAFRHYAAAAFTAILVLAGMAAPANASVAEPATGLATIKGIVRDEGGSPIADATVAIFRLGTSKLLKQVRSANDGSYLAKILPGRYTILAVAEGFNPVTLSDVQVDSASLSSYGFKLERAGGGNTLPEKRLDRNNPKWVRRAASISRSIYQNQEGAAPVETTVEIAENTNADPVRKPETVVETFASGSETGAFAGINVATRLPLADNAEAILAAQTGIGPNAPQRIESQLSFRPSDRHHLRVKAGFAVLGDVKLGPDEEQLGQFSFQATDEWKVREGIVLVYGIDYSKFVGAGTDFSLNPRLGFQYDLDARTRLRTSYTSFTEDRTWSRAVELEDAQVIFREPVAIEDIAVESGKPVMNRSSRFEIGFERVLDNSSSIEINAFFDTTFARGVGYSAFGLASMAGDDFTELVGNQEGASQGARIVYSRRLSGIFSAAAGYSYGIGQKLSAEALSDPDSLFETAQFHTIFGQLEADFDTGTSVRTVFRLSPAATVFAIDPFQGRLAIYDPGLSFLVTQKLPNLGLPFRAEAAVDARNLFDIRSGLSGDDGTLLLNAHRRALRGSIMLRF